MSTPCSIAIPSSWRPFGRATEVRPRKGESAAPTGTPQGDADRDEGPAGGVPALRITGGTRGDRFPQPMWPVQPVRVCDVEHLAVMAVIVSGDVAGQCRWHPAYLRP